MEALRRKKDFVGGTVGGALVGMAYGVTGAAGFMFKGLLNGDISCVTAKFGRLLPRFV